MRAKWKLFGIIRYGKLKKKKIFIQDLNLVVELSFQTIF